MVDAAGAAISPHGTDAKREDGEDKKPYVLTFHGSLRLGPAFSFKARLGAGLAKLRIATNTLLAAINRGQEYHARSSGVMRPSRNML